MLVMPALNFRQGELFGLVLTSSLNSGPIYFGQIQIQCRAFNLLHSVIFFSLK